MPGMVISYLNQWTKNDSALIQFRDLSAICGILIIMNLSKLILSFSLF